MIHRPFKMVLDCRMMRWYSIFAIDFTVTHAMFSTNIQITGGRNLKYAKEQNSLLLSWTSCKAWRKWSGRSELSEFTLFELRDLLRSLLSLKCNVFLRFLGNQVTFIFMTSIADNNPAAFSLKNHFRFPHFNYYSLSDLASNKSIKLLRRLNLLQ